MRKSCLGWHFFVCFSNSFLSCEPGTASREPTLNVLCTVGEFTNAGPPQSYGPPQLGHSGTTQLTVDPAVPIPFATATSSTVEACFIMNHVLLQLVKDAVRFFTKSHYAFCQRRIPNKAG
eukprot:2197489-Amphidinium_carterae.2